MKANELMIGDWMRHANGTPMQVTRIDYTQDGGHFACGTPHCWEYNNKFETVPLTGDILTANGFYSERNIGYVYEDGEHEVIVDLWNHDCRILYNRDVVVNIHCFFDIAVHELQHALRLCGVEKEIKLEG